MYDYTLFSLEWSGIFCRLKEELYNIIFSKTDILGFEEKYEFILRHKENTERPSFIQ